MSDDASRAQRAAAILTRLRARYPDPGTALHWSTPWELLVGTVLAAQCTDERVNKVMPPLLERWPDAEAMADADSEDIAGVIRSTGLFRQKAKNLAAAARMVRDEFGGELPQTLKEMTRLPGVARKTGSIVLSSAFGVNEGLAVDTHVRRLSYRLGLTDSTNVAVIERDLMPLFPQEAWGEINHMLVWFGREVCSARTPRCSECELADICPKRGVEGVRERGKHKN